MQKKYWYQFLYGISILLIIGFFLRLATDYIKYNPIANSAPFYVFLLVRAVEFLLPSGIVYIIAKIVKKKL